MKYVMLCDIRSHYNVGAIFRTCDGAGVAKVFLAGYTPAPVDRFGRSVPEIHKTALGAETAVPWEFVTDAAATLAKLKEEGFKVVVVEQVPGSVMFADFAVPTRVVYVFGSETEGVPKEIVDLADTVLELPMHGMKESLNVSVTAGIVLYHT
jgi:23S rRNA (guanosine2251-2'-O)-methyltransferase